MINSPILQQLLAIHQRFVNAKPFRHTLMEDFFDPAVMTALLAEFPGFQQQNAINEFGDVGGKAVVTRLDDIGPAFKALYAYLNSRAFLDVMSAITGIRDLLPDPALYGGGTHENVEGQELDPHVDYNYLQSDKLHRRLNLLVYFNEEWDEEWGGCIELHANPRDPANNEVISFAPLYNRALIFETNEYSWHGFKKIRLPADKKHLSRRSLAIYLYTRDRPVHEVVAPHGTFYVQRPLPANFQPGMVLDESSLQEIRLLLRRRDDWIHYYQRKELADSATIQRLRSELVAAGLSPDDVNFARHVRLSLQSPGYLLQWLYRSLPLPGSIKRRLKDAIFLCFGFMLKRRKAYQRWQAGRSSPAPKD
jgi:hypothetical protein